jgi:hypothetical protein
MTMTMTMMRERRTHDAASVVVRWHHREGDDERRRRRRRRGMRKRRRRRKRQQQHHSDHHRGHSCHSGSLDLRPPPPSPPPSPPSPLSVPFYPLSRPVEGRSGCQIQTSGEVHFSIVSQWGGRMDLSILFYRSTYIFYYLWSGRVPMPAMVGVGSLGGASRR